MDDCHAISSSEMHVLHRAFFTGLLWPIENRNPFQDEDQNTSKLTDIE